MIALVANLFIHVALLLSRIVAQEYTFCGVQPSSYGAPNAGDCNSLLDEIANPQDEMIRLFDEEQLRTSTGSWPGLKDMVPPTMLGYVVQIPRIFSRSMLGFRPLSEHLADLLSIESCNILLTSFSSGVGGAVPHGKTSWANINQRGHVLTSACLGRKAGAAGGVVTIKDCRQNK